MSIFEHSDYSTFDILNWVQHEHNGTQLHRNVKALYDNQLCYRGGGTPEEFAADHRNTKKNMITLIHAEQIKDEIEELRAGA